MTDRDDVARRYLAGEKLEAIGALYGVTRQRIEQIARELGLPHRPVRVPKPKRRKITRWGNEKHAERNQRIIAAREGGRRFEDIAADEGMTFYAVRAVWERWGPVPKRASARRFDASL